MQRKFENTKITVEFDEAGNRQQVSSGDSLKTLFGKIKKWFSDLKPVAFSGSYNDLSDKPETTEVPKGFDHRDNDLAWGTQEGEYVTAWNAGDNCSVGFRKNCPTNGKVSMILDGTVYVDEGKYPVVNHNEYDKFNQVIRVGTMSGNAESCKNNPWYKVAELETNVAADDNNMTLLISTEFQSSYKYWGVIRITTRTSLEKKFELGSIEWAFTNKRTSSYNDNKWLLLHNNDNPCKCEVWTKLSGRWENISVRLLSSSGTFDFVSKWKLINHNLNDLKTGSSSYTEGMDIIDATYGNFLVGNICYDGSKCVHPMIKFIDNQIDEYGNGIAIGGGGATIIGGGESSNAIAEQFDSEHMEDGKMHGGDEKMIVANDGAIDFYTDCQNGFGTAKHISMSNGNVTANQFIGNATSASKIKSEYIIANSDLNTYVESGIYYNNFNVETKTLANCPTQNAFVMSVKRYGELNTGTQEITEYLVSNPKRYMRNFYNGTWGEWYRVYTTADPPTTTNVDWTNVQNKPTIPTKTSQLTNDSNFVTTSGNVASATKLATARTINGTSFNGTGNITTSKWGTARTVTIGNCSKSVDGSGNVTFSLSNIGALYNNCSSDGAITINGIKFYTIMNGSTFKVVDAENICCSNGYLKVVNSTGGYNGIYASQFSTQSSRRVKTNITPMTETEARKILDVDVVGYDYINGAKDQYGMIAEDVHNIIPNIVSGNVDCDDDDKEAVSSIGIDYSKAVPYLIKMVQMMEVEIRELKKELKMRDKIDE